MFPLRRFLDFYINSSVHVSVAVSVLVAITLMEFNIPLSPTLLLLIFFGSITGYNFVKYAPIVKFRHKSLSPFLKQIKMLSLFCFGIMIVLSLYQQINVILLLGLLAMITFFYTVPLVNRNLRGLQSIKIFIVALVWASVTVLLPVIDFFASVDFDHWISFMQRFLLVVVLTIPFEIRDLTYDSRALGTFPQILGIKASKIFGIMILLLVVIIEFLKDRISISYLSGLIVTVLITGIFLLLTKKSQSRYYASFWVESIPMMWILVYCFLS